MKGTRERFRQPLECSVVTHTHTHLCREAASTKASSKKQWQCKRPVRRQSGLQSRRCWTGSQRRASSVLEPRFQPRLQLERRLLHKPLLPVSSSLAPRELRDECRAIALHAAQGCVFKRSSSFSRLSPDPASDASAHGFHGKLGQGLGSFERPLSRNLRSVKSREEQFVSSWRRIGDRLATGFRRQALKP